ncbi:FUN34 transmembrane protein [Laetiporus sulphureus 93-53]|uniref:FUN34 transmembrane protein n=1 Tax=Laetiporus sulphureus 93-53 TaxID=1314785 RepID=A0A165AWC0_9APHY|nr:FUN34 transmembrane protein [Laetiporus sulphureus 93-53]KZS99782.1 FUN34 transmembrane protein [Laetiporus sulphureus 93-53]
MSSHSHSQFEKAEKVESGEIAEVNALPTRTALGPSTPQFRKLGNPGPLGLFAFAGTTLMLSLFNASVRDIHTTNAIMAMALFVGGLAQFAAGMWEFACANTFGATAFTMYGAFWMSYATIFIPGSGISAAYADAAEDYATALGMYLMMWFIITFLLFVASTRRNIGMCALFFFLTITFLLLGIAELVKSTSAACAKAGGWTGIITAFIAFYVGQAQLMIREESWFTMPIGVIPQRLN